MATIYRTATESPKDRRPSSRTVTMSPNPPRMQSRGPEATSEEAVVGVETDHSEAELASSAH